MAVIEVTQERSATGRIVAHKLDPGVFVVEIPEVGRRVSLGQPPDVIKRLQQAGYRGPEGVTDFVLVDSKLQGDSTSWVLVEFPVLYALYAVRVPVDGRQVPAFFAGRRPRLIGLPDDLAKAMRMVKLGNYGVDRLDEIDAWDLPEATREALRREILGLAVGNRIQDSDSFLEGVALDPAPRSEHEFSEIGDGIRIGRIARNTYRFAGRSFDVLADRCDPAVLNQNLIVEKPQNFSRVDCQKRRGLGDDTVQSLIGECQISIETENALSLDLL